MIKNEIKKYNYKIIDQNRNILDICNPNKHNNANYVMNKYLEDHYLNNLKINGFSYVQIYMIKNK